MPCHADRLQLARGRFSRGPLPAGDHCAGRVLVGSSPGTAVRRRGTSPMPPAGRCLRRLRDADPTVDQACPRTARLRKDAFEHAFAVNSIAEAFGLPPGTGDPRASSLTHPRDVAPSARGSAAASPTVGPPRWIWHSRSIPPRRCGTPTGRGETADRRHRGPTRFLRRDRRMGRDAR